MRRFMRVVVLIRRRRYVCTNLYIRVQFSQLSSSVVSDSLRPHGLQRARLPCPQTPRAYSNSCALSWWRHPTISSSVIPFSSCLQPFSASGSFPMSQFFASGGQSIGVSASASVLVRVGLKKLKYVFGLWLDDSMRAGTRSVFFLTLCSVSCSVLSPAGLCYY